MTSQNVIRRRKLAPLLARAYEVVHHYEKAANCAVSVLGYDCCQENNYEYPKVCTLCIQQRRYAKKPQNTAGHPCVEKHYTAVKNSRHLGGSYIYMCDMGFVFWTTPLFSEKRFAGALLANGVIGVTQNQVAVNIYNALGSRVPMGEILRFIDGFPEKSCETVKAMAQMMLICAEQISRHEDENPAEARDILCDGKDSVRERKLLANLRRGDTEDARKIIDEILRAAHLPGNFSPMRIKAIELIVLISRVAAGAKNEDASNILETNNRYLKKIEDADSEKELSAVLNTVIDHMSGKIFSFQGFRHSSALRKAERYIRGNFTQKISLQKIARAAGLSAPYFSTIFKNETGENLCNYLNRLRIGKAAGMLAETTMPISDISSACGFEDQSWFSKIFKNYTGSSPGKYRERGGICAAADWTIEKISAAKNIWKDTVCAG